MVSSLWKACQDGDAARVDDLLNDASSVDIEIKDHTGVTPLIQAVKGGHLHVVKALLAKGADPTNASAQGRPETYTTDPHILHVLAAARGEPVMSYPDPAQYYPYPQYAQYPGYPDPNAGWYPPPPPPPPPQMPQEGEHAANLPPPEVARNIPCRYYPACRYGSACVFAHPQAPYFPGPLPPPAQYGPPPSNPVPPPQHYDPNMPPPPGAYPYYPVSPPFNPHPHPHPHQHPHPHPVSPTVQGHMRTHSEILSPPPFSPTHLPVSVPVPVQYLPPPQMSPSYPMPPPSAYARRASVTSLASYPSPIALDPAHGPPVTKLPDVQGQGQGPGQGQGQGPGNGRQRRGSAAFRDGRPPYGGRKPPCLFFPSGRCRNGEDCRFPHVMPEGGVPPPPHARNHFPPRSRAGPGSGYYGSRDGANGGSGYGNLEERLAGLSVRDNNASRETPSHETGTGGTSTPHSTSTKPGTSVNGTAKPHHPGHTQNNQNHVQPRPQRVPSADEFPVLQANGHAHPTVNGHTHAQNGSASAGPGPGANGHAHANGWVNAVNGTGPTAAQILRERDAAAAGSRGPSPRPTKDPKSQAAATVTATAPENLASNSKPAEVQVSA